MSHHGFMAERTWKLRRTPGEGRRLIVLEACLMSGPMTGEFIKQNPVACRRIEIPENQTLAHLHHAIFRAFDRHDQHMYEFQFGKGPHDPRARRYVLPGMFKNPVPGSKETFAGDVTRTALKSLNLKPGMAFGYWFDYGDDWYHQVNVAGYRRGTPGRRYPRVTRRTGQSPPQYVDWDKEEARSGRGKQAGRA